MKILHVEDDRLHHKHILEMLVRLFGKEMKVDWSTSVEEGIKALNRNAYDLVLLDYMLADGTAADVMRAVDASHQSMPFIVISGFDDHEFDLSALHVGADDYLIKGKFDLDELERSIAYSTYRKRKMTNLTRLAFYDALTGLPNSNYLRESVAKSVFLSTRLGRLVGVYAVEMLGFRKLNDQKGREVGDHVLKTVAGRLGEAMRRTDTVVRLTGDEFLVVSPGLARRAEVTRVADKIAAAMDAPVELADGGQVRPSFCVGAAIIPFDADDLDGATRVAERAVQKATDEGLPFWMFERSKQARAGT